MQRGITTCLFVWVFSTNSRRLIAEVNFHTYFRLPVTYFMDRITKTMLFYVKLRWLESSLQSPTKLLRPSMKFPPPFQCCCIVPLGFPTHPTPQHWLVVRGWDLLWLHLDWSQLF